MGRKEDLSIKSNKGFSMITVILTVGLVGVLVMLVIYMVMANFRMKMSNLKEKDAFYTAERALEEIRTGLQEDVAEAMSESYTSVMESYSRSSSNTDVAMDEQRQNAYEKQFLSILQTRLKGTETRLGYYDIGKLRNYVDLDKEDSFDTQKESLVITTISEKDAVLSVDPSNKKVTLKNLKVIYIDARGHAAIIQTDIQLGVPHLQFPTPSTLPDLMNMIVVAGQGIYCTTDNPDNLTVIDPKNEIQGSVYAGILPETKREVDATSDTSIYLKSGTTLEISKGERTVSAGEITVGNQGTFTSAGETTLWAQGINVSSATVELSGKTYLSDDLTVKPGTGSYVKLSGEYYGYGDVESAKESENRIEYGHPKSTDSTQTTKKYEAKSSAALSSAITINGKSTTLDMSGLDKLFLAGRNYIASKALPTSATTGSGTDNTTSNDDVLTGESITVKGTQLAYLVPDSLFIGDYHNPMSQIEYDSAAGIDREKDDSETVKGKIKTFAKTKIDTTKTAKTLGNKTLSEIGVDTSESGEPVQTVFYNDGSGTYVYFYLNFTNEKKASEFLQNYYNNTSLKKAMNTYLSFYFKGNSILNSTSGIYVNKNAYTRYLVGGNVLSYDGSTKTGNLVKENSEEETASEVTEEEIGYQNMWYALKRKMIGSYHLLKKEVKDKDGIAHDETAVDRNVFDNLVNEKDLVQFIVSHRDTTADGSLRYESSEMSCTFTASEDDGGLQSIMAHNGKSSTFLVKDDSATSTDAAEVATKEKTVSGANTELVITADKAKKLRLVVCTGDVRIRAGVTFKGIIMAKGTITLEPGAKLQSSPLDAAKAFQSQINSSDGISPKDFFWEGDKYVLGNSQTSDDTTSGDKDSSVYHVEDYVTYKNWERK